MKKIVQLQKHLIEKFKVLISAFIILQLCLMATLMFAQNYSSFTQKSNNLIGDIGDYATPAIADIDGDGLLDLLVGEEDWQSSIRRYEQSSSGSTSFSLITVNFNNIIKWNCTLTFTDIDGDGLLDLITGDRFGGVSRYEQDSENSVSFSSATISIDIPGENSNLTFTDLDGDGLLDVLVGDQLGCLEHSEQSAPGSTTFNMVNHDFIPDVGYYSAPTIIDLDGDGLLDLLIGERDGKLIHYEQDDVNSLNFILVPNSFDNLDVITRSVPVFTDLDGDNHLDLIIGNYTGYLYLYEGDNAVPSTIWTGTTDNTWNTTTNWHNGKVPKNGTYVIIPTEVNNYPTLSSAGFCFALKIESGNTTGSLLGNIYLGTNGITTVERNIPQYNKGTTGFHLLSSPVAAQYISTEFFNVENPSANDDFYYFNEEHNYWINIKNIGGTYNQGGTWEHFSSADNPTFTVGKGYLVAYNANITKNFTGSLNSGDKASGTDIPAITYNPGQGEGWNLIGNPFPSAIDWDNGIWSRTNVDGSVYVYDAVSGQYKSWNGLEGGLTDGIIPAMQGFFVKANAAAPSITIPEASRVHSSQDYYKSSETVADLLVLKVAGNAYEDEIFINFNENASNGFDNEFDAYKIYGTEEAPQLYSIIPDDILSINVLPYSNEKVLIPLGLKVGAADEYIFSVKKNTFFKTVQVYLEDLENGTTTELKTTTGYTFTSNPEDDPKRFVLHLDGVSGIEDNVQSDNLRFYVYNNKLYIIDKELKNGTIQLFNMLGQPVMEKRYSETVNTLDLNLSEGYYIVRIITDKSSVSGKIFVE